MSENRCGQRSIPTVTVSTPSAYPHEVLGVVLSVRDGVLCVLLWRRAYAPHADRWALPGGSLGPSETLAASIARHLATKVDVDELSHLEQLETLGDPQRHPTDRLLATAYLGVVSSDASPDLPDDTAWHPVGNLPAMAFDHGELVAAGWARLRSKLSYTNLGFALAPPSFTMSELRRIYEAALGYDVDATNLQRVLVRRAVIEATDEVAPPGRSGGRPAARFGFRTRELVITDPFAVLRPPEPV